ncbi:MAG: TMEM165/GDT1 family protein [Elusimicrobiota bacterium]
MNWAVFFTALATCFIAELGDKTQLAALSLAASSKAPWSVFSGAVLGLALVTVIAVLLGETVAKAIPGHYIHRTSALLFIAIGVWMLLKTGSP